MTLNVIVDIGPVLTNLGKQFMATLADFTAALDSNDQKLTDLSTDVQAIAAEIADLKTKVAAGNMTAEEETQALSRVQAQTQVLDNVKAALDAAK